MIERLEDRFADPEAVENPDSAPKSEFSSPTAAEAFCDGPDADADDGAEDVGRAAGEAEDEPDRDQCFEHGGGVPECVWTPRHDPMPQLEPPMKPPGLVLAGGHDDPHLDHKPERRTRPFVWHKTADEILDNLAAYLRTNLRLRTLGDL